MIGSTNVHIGSTNYYSVCPESTKTKKNNWESCDSERTYDVNRLLDSKLLISREHIDIISTHLGASWREIGKALGYSNGQLDNFQEDNKTSGNKEVSITIF